MSSQELRQKFLGFFAERGHAVVPSSSLIPDDPSVLLTTAGMQQFKPYYTGEADPMTTIHPSIGKPLGSRNAASVQKSFRTSDIDEVGDERHLTFFEMLGNFSFGGYFKKEAIQYAYDFIVKELGLMISYVSVFEGLDSIGVPEDKKSAAIWQKLDPNITIKKEGVEDVFWGPTGASGPCGPTTEIYCKNGAGQDIEIWNLVFNEFFFPGSREELITGNTGKKLEPLKTQGVDTGAGLERLAMVAQGTNTIFETDLFEPLINALPTAWTDNKVKRILTDHARAIAFLVSDGVRPANKGAGYVLRRLIRRSVIHAYLKQATSFRGGDTLPMGIEEDLKRLLDAVVKHYSPIYQELSCDAVFSVFDKERMRFGSAFKQGLREIRKVEAIDAPLAFKIYESYGLPFELIQEFGGEKAKDITREVFDDEFKKHQEISRAGAEAKFGGHGLYLKTGEVTIRDESEVEKVTRLHTATHLLHAGLRAVLGPEVRQDGSDITVERTRFDFRFGRKVTPEELQRVEEWVANAIRKDLSVKWEEMPYEKAIAQGALGFFHEKYPAVVKVYSVYDPKTGEVFSRELCGGPHVTHAAEIGEFKITKEESSSAGVRRIRAVVKP